MLVRGEFPGLYGESGGRGFLRIELLGVLRFEEDCRAICKVSLF
jgi:hypothetical protein